MCCHNTNTDKCQLCCFGMDITIFVMIDSMLVALHLVKG